ncbi:hypothetical protein [Lacipirellula limnantheis]|uniref:Uncharacterized protein n=1 Tax=Lacipirellula limnantheis TaxID=2528024 RepID=A0A517U618_9BACT|nr:hypothetical protein [Lacipirellula limnantheis]QDT76010.1 hypothetical protein I41_52550 [Lacipirellula limnantheis]
MRFHSFIRFRYSLRALLVVMTLLALFFWYHIDWIKQRRASLAQENIKSFGQSPNDAQPSAPGLLWLFGEPGYGNITVENGDGSVDVEQLQNLFPESGMMVFGDNDFFPQVLKPKLKR